MESNNCFHELKCDHKSRSLFLKNNKKPADIEPQKSKADNIASIVIIV